MKLNISRGIRREPPRIVIHGGPGIGKTTLASRAPNPVFIDLEHGTNQVDVPRIDKINTWEELLATVRALAEPEYDYKTVVIDTLDRAEWLCWQHICQTERVTSIEKACKGFGKGYIAAYEEFRKLAAALERLRIDRGMSVIIIAHSKVEKAPNAAGEEFERWTLKVHRHVAGLFYEQCDAILFARTVVYTRKTEAGRVKGFGDARVLETQESPAWLAKNRYALPAQLPLSWEDLDAAMNRGAAAVLDSIRAEVDAALARFAGLDPDAAERARVACDGVSDATRLSVLLGRINAGISTRLAAQEG